MTECAEKIIFMGVSAINIHFFGKHILTGHRKKLMNMHIFVRKDKTEFEQRWSKLFVANHSKLYVGVTTSRRSIIVSVID